MSSITRKLLSALRVVYFTFLLDQKSKQENSNNKKEVKTVVNHLK